MVENGVFYNPVQIFNRDFTLLVMQAYINQQRIQSKLYDNIQEAKSLMELELLTRFLQVD